MLFNSLEFLVFFITVSILYYTIPFKYRWLLLLIASCFFYMVFKPIYILILGFTIIVDYYIGIWLGNEQNQRKRKQIIILSLVANLGVLAVFKYYNFFIDNFNEVITIFGSSYEAPYLGILLPIGLSFHTFQAMSYTIEVYRGKFPSEKHLGIYSLYVMFYPQLVAGPIERPQNVIPQLKKNIYFKYENLSEGFKLILLGLFKKIVVADRLSYFVNSIYDTPEQYEGFATWIGTFFFCFQIYCDFSGYSDIALGTAKTMGYDLMENFKNPYYSKSISEFWKRWHISLSTWFKDYLYIPLGGNRVGRILNYRNIFIVFIISGFWHGAGWNYIFWGFLHAIFLTTGVMIRNNFENHISIKNILLKKLVSLSKLVGTFSLVWFAWIFFRAKNWNQSIIILQGLTKIKKQQIGIYVFGDNAQELILSFTAIGILAVIQYIGRNKRISIVLNDYGKITSWSFYLVLTFIIIIFGAFHNSGEFIYFQF